MRYLGLPLGLTIAAFLCPGIPASAAAPPVTPSFNWLNGHWCSQTNDELIEEYWLPAAGGLSLGVSRTVKAGKASAFEFMRIENDQGVVAYIAQPQGRPPTIFRLTASGADWARFENPQHDFPKRVEYRRTSAGLRAEIAGPGDAGKETVIAFNYRRCVD